VVYTFIRDTVGYGQIPGGFLDIGDDSKLSNSEYGHLGKDGKRQKVFFAGDNVLWGRMSGMRIEDSRESRDVKRDFAKILTVLKGTANKA
jgi:hypothetical protein